jgi:uncharacterized GH25 family protein
MKPWLLLLLFVASVAAQDITLMPDSFFVSTGERVTVHIHGMPPAGLKDPSMYTATGAYNMLNLRAGDNGAMVDASIKGPGTPVLTVQSVPAVSAGRERHTGFAKAILLADDKPDDGFARRVGHALEIVPDRNPFTLKTGASLPMLVLLNGAPAVSVELTAVSQDNTVYHPGRTAADGRIVVPLPKAGSWKLYTTSRRRSGEPSIADWDVYTASLTFELK